MRIATGLMALVVAAGVLGGCASHRVRPELLRQAAEAELARADALLLDGCYACLTEGRDTYDRLKSGPLGPVASARLFAAEVLIVLREKELAIDTQASMARLEAASVGLPLDLDVARLLRLVELIPPNASGLSEVEYAGFIRDHVGAARNMDDDFGHLESSSLWTPAREYLTLSVQCSDLGRPLLAAGHRWRDSGAPGDFPLLAYRRAVCAGAAGFPVLDTLRETTPRLTEAAYVLARTAPMATERANSKKTKALASDALRDFPQSPAVTYLMATLQQMSANFREALRLYTATLALRDRHENAQLGRTVALTYLARPEDAIEAATTLVGWRSTNLRDGYYWRAFNQHVLHQLDEARRDIDRSKQLGSSLENHTLAGVIEYEQDDLVPALNDLNRGWSLGFGSNCTAAWYQGLVHVKREAWPDAAGGFDRAMGCYAKNVTQDRTELAAMGARTDLDPEFQRTQMENLTLALQDDQRQRWASAMNAANCFARAGDLARAETLLLIAAEDPALADDVLILRTLLDQQERTAAPAAVH